MYQASEMVEQITSVYNPLVKHLVKLRESKPYRKQCQRLVLSGWKMIQEISRHHRFHTLLLLEETPLPEDIRADQIYRVTLSILKKVTGLEQPEPVAAEITRPDPSDLTHVPLLLILDAIADPGNLGTLLRTALALGWSGAFITDSSVDPFNDKALRAAKGALFSLPFQQGSLQQLSSLLDQRGGILLAADIRGEELPFSSFPLPLALVLGNESHGPHPLLKKQAQQICIPMHPHMESLNVASAGAIFMYQIQRGSL